METVFCFLNAAASLSFDVWKNTDYGISHSAKLKYNQHDELGFNANIVQSWHVFLTVTENPKFQPYEPDTLGTRV